MKKLLVVVLAFALVLSMNVMAFAADGSNSNSNKNESSGDNGATYSYIGSTSASDGTKVTTYKTVDGSKIVETKDASGNLTVEITAVNAEDDTIAVKSEVAEDKTTIYVDTDKEVTVSVAVKDADVNTVAVIVNEDGTETVVCSTKQTSDGVSFKIAKDAKVVIKENAKTFTDFNEATWAKENMEFVSAREIFKGVTTTEFGPLDTVTRQMVFTALARFDGNNKAEYAEGVAWAKTENITDGTALTANITRQELAVAMYRYAGCPATNGSIAKYSDAADVADWAAQAMQWCVEKGIFNGVGDTLLPQAEANRAELAAVIQRFCNAF